ncbi:hypothetical protein PUN28_015856 [Cardiocondyla obscurior]|uniref:Uncharacterized protein n=1 Tax=Cardiocondyla obscurior TaxID=286306 RepID=A0AAW2EPL7_9HYME
MHWGRARYFSILERGAFYGNRDGEEKIGRKKERDRRERASERASGINGAVTLECCAVVGVIGGVSSVSTLAAFGNRCSCTDAKLSRRTEFHQNLELPFDKLYHFVSLFNKFLSVWCNRDTPTMTLRSRGIECARGLPGFTQYQSHVFHIRHIDTRLSIDHVAAKLLHGALELAEIRKCFVEVSFSAGCLLASFLKKRIVLT